MTDYSGTINSIKFGATGITDELAAKMHAVGGHYLAIVDLKVKETGEDLDDGKKIIKLVIDQLEPVVDGKLNGALVDHVRQINAALHRNRMLAENGPQLPIDGESTSTVEEVLAGGPALIDHDDEGPKLTDPDDWDYPAGEGDKTTVQTIEDPFLAQEPATTGKPS